MIRQFQILLIITCLVLANCALSQSSTQINTSTSNQESQDDNEPGSNPPESIEDLVGNQRGFFHSFFSFNYAKTDNVYRSNTNRIEDTYITMLPGFWLAFPPSNEQVVPLSTSGSATGGLSVTRGNIESGQQLKSFLYYGLDIQKYANETENDTQNQTIEGIIQYTLKSGISFEMLGQYRENSKYANLTSNTTTNDYYSTLYGYTIYVDLGESAVINLSYQIFKVDLKDVEFDELDRIDKSFVTGFDWDYSDKTSLSATYNVVKIEYITGSNHSTQVSGTLGVNWEASDKTGFRFNIGQNERDYDLEEATDSKTTTFNMSINYAMTSKTNISVYTARQTAESFSIEYNSTETLSYGGIYQQRINNRLSTTLSLQKTWEEHIDAVNDTSREDMTINFSFQLNYIYSDWFESELGLSKLNTKSNNDAYNIITNEYRIGASVTF